MIWDTRTRAGLPLTRLRSAECSARMSPASKRIADAFCRSSCFLLLAGAPPVLAGTPSQEEVFRSIQTNVGGGEVDASRVLPILLAAAGFVLLLVVASQRRKRVVAPKPLRHQGKLLREVLRTVPLRGREVKLLKALAENAGADEAVTSPLTLLLCPSLMARTIKSKRVKIDGRALASVARKAGLQVTRK